MVLTNRGTLGAAEVVAAALTDNKRAQVVGERTFGDAAVRRAVPTEDGGAVLLAVAKYYSPAGKAIQDNPVVPAFMVNDIDGESIDDDAEETPAQTPAEPAAKKPGEDPVLKKGLEVLNGTAVPDAVRDAARNAPIPVAPKTDSTAPTVPATPPHQK